MAWSEDHKQRSREKILTTAAGLFARQGFDNVSIDQVMQAAGMTRGAFYAHFSSKTDLYAEAILYAANTAAESYLPQGQATDQQREAFIAAYLSEAHCQGADIPCPLAFLVSDMAHQDEGVRSTWSQVFQGLVKRLQNNTGEGSAAQAEEQQAALQKVVMMIGGVAVARALNDNALATEVLEACRAGALSTPPIHLSEE
ncbi:TetR/AcrR family transcriptional regulator [Marinobacterium mangrovicola]|uniref:TetR family transcriptional regulator n=1 Tax=Marinobacterium mangrovicola TaxID=1476959 RepID=A0A4R1GK22_9GAMM|nr:TetR/AcrR family transcriptional regulator [Marinobacterium mangrovicola]TCK08747.1 TetR family transcriptional regulator [Marinobacterium mangrovicola]